MTGIVIRACFGPAGRGIIQVQRWTEQKDGHELSSEKLARSMAVTYYVALPFIRTEDGAAPGAAQECQSEAAAIRRAEGMSRDPAYAGAVEFKRAGDPNVGEFSDAVVLKKFGDVPNDLSELWQDLVAPSWPMDAL
jgi:hypothetical protein